MKNILFLIVLFLPFATPLTARAQAPDGMYACSTSSDCIVVADFCANNWRAINRSQIASYEQWAAEMKSYVECMQMKPSPKPTAVCENKSRCIIYSPVPGKK